MFKSSYSAVLYKLHILRSFGTHLKPSKSQQFSTWFYLWQTQRWRHTTRYPGVLRGACCNLFFLEEIDKSPVNKYHTKSFELYFALSLDLLHKRSQLFGIGASPQMYRPKKKIQVHKMSCNLFIYIFKVSKYLWHLHIHWASKETYHFFKATLTKIHAIKINNIWTQISFNTP